MLPLLSKLLSSSRVSAHRRIESWVPVRALGRGHRQRIAEHLLALNPQDRYLRFGHAVSNAEIERYVARIDFDRDELNGIFNRRLALIAVSHLAHAAGQPSQVRFAEFGVSVDPAARGRGFGARLFAHAVLQARNHGADRLFIHALSNNTAMLKIARRAGAVVERDGSESDVWLKLPSDDIGSHVEQAMARHAAEANYQFKRRALQAARLLRQWQRIRARLSWRKRALATR